MRISALLTIIAALPCLAGEITTSQLVDTAHRFSAIVITVPVDQNYGFSLLDVRIRKEGDNIQSYWNPTNDILMINGGYFNPDFSPTGFCRIDETEISATRSAKLSGFVAIDKAGAINILSIHDNPTNFPTMLQAGPFVIDPGGSIGIKSRSGADARRTLIGLMQDGNVVIVVTEPIGLLDLAHSIKQHLPSVERLLNLDGGPSTALMIKGHSVVNQWPVRNYITKKRETPTSKSTVPFPAAGNVR
jgi:hypothetical protein